MRIWMWYFEEDSMTDGHPTCWCSLTGAASWTRSSAGRGCAWQALHGVMERMSCLQTLDPAPSPPRDFSFSRVNQGGWGEVTGPEYQPGKGRAQHCPSACPSCLLFCGQLWIWPVVTLVSNPSNTTFLSFGLQIWWKPRGICIWENDPSLALEAPPKVGSRESGFWAPGQGGPGTLTSGCGAVPTVSAGLGIRQAGAPWS